MLWHSQSRVNNDFSGIPMWFRSSRCLTKSSKPYLLTTTVLANLPVKPLLEFLCEESIHPVMAAYFRTDTTIFIPAQRMQFDHVYIRKQQCFVCTGHACAHMSSGCDSSRLTLAKVISPKLFRRGVWTTDGRERHHQEISSIGSSLSRDLQNSKLDI